MTFENSITLICVIESVLLKGLKLFSSNEKTCLILQENGNIILCGLRLKPLYLRIGTLCMKNLFIIFY